MRNNLYGREFNTLSFINSSMSRNKEDYIESKIPPEKHEHLGWFWDLVTKKFYRWNDLPGREHGIINGNS